ncbi:uncharacterized protein LOC116112803 [Pistacia vera]|uniref:uncharacterized protein LOC116112803 n=1 Tax=Pistacia vera TaxID=55513 RepID=UPI001263283D|nr:uncharacterized protein LOC116112803 [Pistacia vera]
MDQRVCYHSYLLGGYKWRASWVFSRQKRIEARGPLSLYLFTLVIQVLSLIIRHKIWQREDFKYRHRCDKLGISHLCFADDLFLFYHGDFYSVQVLHDALIEFSEFSSLVPNIAKSSTLFCNVKDKHWAVINNIMGFAEVVQTIEKLLHSSLWSGTDMCKGKVRIAWKDVWSPKNEGGMGIRSLKSKNIALMMYHLWSILSISDSLWVKWIHTYKLRGKSFWNIRIAWDASWCWRKLLKMRDQVRNHIRIDLGNGQDTFLWFDNWHPQGPLDKIIPSRIFYVSGLRHNARVSDIIRNDHWEWPKVLGEDYPCVTTYTPHISMAGTEFLSVQEHAKKYRYFGSFTVWGAFVSLSIIVEGAIVVMKVHNEYGVVGIRRGSLLFGQGSWLVILV